MLQIIVPAQKDLWDERRAMFISTEETVLQMEHSLVSLQKWESKWNKPFITKSDKTTEEIIDYIRCMTLTKDIDPYIFYSLTEENIKKITEYINAPMTATTFNGRPKHSKQNNSQVTAEIIYYNMVALSIPYECREWHLNQLTTLIKVCDEKNQTPKKMSKADTLKNNAAINAARRKPNI